MDLKPAVAQTSPISNCESSCFLWEYVVTEQCSVLVQEVTAVFLKKQLVIIFILSHTSDLLHRKLRGSM